VTLAYLHSSAFVKTLVDEPESARLETWLEEWPERASCALLRMEAVRAVRVHGSEAVARTRRALAALLLVQLDDELLDAAAELAPNVRSLDAIHLAAARSLGPDLGVIATYDDRMTSAARELGLDTAAP
jgi:uncharacterized protein